MRLVGADAFSYLKNLHLNKIPLWGRPTSHESCVVGGVSVNGEEWESDEAGKVALLVCGCLSSAGRHRDPRTGG